MGSEFQFGLDRKDGVGGAFDEPLRVEKDQIERFTPPLVGGRRRDRLDEGPETSFSIRAFLVIQRLPGGRELGHQRVRESLIRNPA